MKNEPDGTPPAPDYKTQLLNLLGLSADATEEQIAQAIQAEKDLAAAAQLEEQAAKEAEIDELLAGYKMPVSTRTILRETLLNDRAKGEALLAAMQKKSAPAEGDLPPAPTHIHRRHTHDASVEQKVAAGNRLIAEVQAEGKFKDYTSARAEARRRNPVLFE